MVVFLSCLDVNLMLFATYMCILALLVKIRKRCGEHLYGTHSTYRMFFYLYLIVIFVVTQLCYEHYETTAMQYTDFS